MSRQSKKKNEAVEAATEVNLSDVIRVRHEKLAALREAGADPFKITKYPQDAYSADIKERFADLDEYERVKDRYLLKKDMLSKARPNMKILHPLPRVNEIEYSIDDTQYAYYFQQAQNGLYAREALICDVLGITLDDVIQDDTIL